MATDGTGTVDLTMEGDDPIRPRPEEINDMNARFDETVDAEVERRIEARNAEHGEALTAATAQGARDAALATLNAMIAGNAGENLDASQFRAKITDMVLAIHGGSDKPPAEHVAEAVRLNEARIQQIAARGGDGAQDRPDVTGSDAGGDDGQFSMPRFLSALGTEVVRMGDRFDATEMTGSPEIEYAKTLLEGNPRAQRQFAALQAQAGPRGRVVPFPMAALSPDAVFAETRAGGTIATRREPDYRRDLLVPKFRPPELLAALGVMQMTIDNDVTFPILTTSQEGAWYTETGDIADETLTVGVQTSSPKRFGSMNNESWMLMVSEGGFGTQALVTSEMSRAQMQRKERQVYDKQGTAVANAPTGVLSATGVDIDALAANTMPTHQNLLGRVTEVASESIPVEMGSFVMGVKARQDLSGVQRFSTGGGQIFNDTAWREGADGPGMNSFGMIRGIVAGQPAYATTQIPVYATADAPIRVSDTYIIFGVWPYVACIDYGTSFLTIDDISRAIAGQTRMTLNSFHDVVVRLGSAFAALRYDAG